MIWIAVLQPGKLSHRVQVTEPTRPDPTPAAAYRRAKELFNASFAALEPLLGRFGRKA